MSRQDDEANKAIRKNTLRSIEAKRRARIRQLKRQYEEAVQEVNIRSALDPERLRAKYAALGYARTEKRRRIAERRIEKYKKQMEAKSRIRPPTLAEEIFSAIVQGVAAVLSISALTIIMYKASVLPASQFEAGKTTFISTFAVFGGCLTLMYVMSTLHHALPAPSAKEVFDRLTHSFVFLVLGAAYTSFTLTAVPTASGWVMFGIVWTLSIVGIVLYAVRGSEWIVANCILYLLVGWTGLIVVRELYHVLPPKSFSFLITSGVIYTMGCAIMLVHRVIKPVRFMHAIADLVMLVGSAYFFLVMAFEIV